MHMPSLDQLLAEVFSRKGYTITRDRMVDAPSGASYTLPIVAETENETLVVDWKLDAPVTAEEAAAFRTVLRDTGGYAGIIVALHGLAPGVAAGTDVDVWDRTRAATEIGDILIEEALSATPPAPEPTQAPAPRPSAPANQNKFTTLVGRAAAVASHGGDVYMYKSKPRETAPPTGADGKPLPYAWGASGAAHLSPTSKAVAEVIRGRKRVPVEEQIAQKQAHAAATPVANVASATPPAPALNDDIEIIVSPKKRRAEPAPDPAPAPAAPAPVAPVPAIADAASAGANLWNQFHGHARAPGQPPAVVQTVLTVDELASAPAEPPAPPAPAAPAIRADPAWMIPAPPQTLCPIISKDFACERAADKVGRAVGGARLALVPTITFEYNAHVDHEALDAPLTGRGAILVSALNGQLREVPAIATTATLPEPADASEAKLEAVDVYDKVKSHLLRQFTREVKLSREVSGVEVFETKKIGPGIDDLGLNHRGITYAPVWVVRGETGVAEVDAITGQVNAA